MDIYQVMKHQIGAGVMTTTNNTSPELTLDELDAVSGGVMLGGPDTRLLGGPDTLPVFLPRT
jgi:hypothetical protein